MTVLALRPNGDYSVALTRSTGSDNYALVDEATLDEADYVYRATNTYATDSYEFSDPSVSGTINNVTLKAYIRNTGTLGTSYAKLTMNGADGDEITMVGGHSTTLYSFAINTNPFTGSAWTWQNINDLTAGVRLKGTGTGGQAQCYQLWVEVDYTPAGFIPGIMRHHFIPSLGGK